MAMTFGEVRELVAPYAGRSGVCVDSPESAIFAKRVLKYLLYSGDNSSIRKVCILVCRGCFVLPPEVEVPLTVRVDHRVGNIWSKWLSYHASGDTLDGKGQCYPAGDVLMEDGAMSPLAYPVPRGGSLIGVMGTCEEADETAVLIQGKDPTGRTIYTDSPEGQVVGERLRVRKGEITYGKVIFGDVTAIKKPQTNGYVQCWAVNPDCDSRQFLADWGPLELTPLYKVYRVNSICDSNSITHLSMLCRVRLKERYHDNEVLFFDNDIALLFAAQRLQAETNNDLPTAGFKKTAVDDMLNAEAGYKNVKGQPIGVFQPLSGGAVRNIVPRGCAFGRRGGTW